MTYSGQTGPKRTPAQIERDRTLIARWAALGYNAKQMTAMLRRETEPAGYTLSHVQVWRDHKANLRELAMQRLEDTIRYRDQQLQQLTYVVHEASLAFELSKQPKRELSAKRITNLVEVTDSDTDTGTRTTSTVGREEVSTRTTERIPSARHLEVIITAAERMAKLLGLDARPEEQGGGGTGTPAPIAKATMPVEEANRLLLAAMGRNVDAEYSKLVCGTPSSMPLRAAQPAGAE